MKAVDPLLSFVVKGPLKAVQDSREVGHADTDQPFQKGVRDCTGQEGLPGPDVAIEQNPDVLGLHFLPVLDVAATDVADLWVPLVVLGEGVLQIGRVRDPVAAKPVHSLLKLPALSVGLLCVGLFLAAFTQTADADRLRVPADGRDRRNGDVHLLPFVAVATAQEAFVVEVVVRFLVLKAFLDHTGQNVADCVHSDHRPSRKSSSSP